MEDEDARAFVNSWEEYAEWERQQQQILDTATRIFVDAAKPLWNLGDGFGGHAFLGIIDEAYKRGLPAPATPPAMPDRVRRLAERDGWECHYCGVSIPQVEHRTPRSRGGSNRLDNLVLACQPCNSAKGTMTDEEFMGAPF